MAEQKTNAQRQREYRERKKAEKAEQERKLAEMEAASATSAPATPQTIIPTPVAAVTLQEPMVKILYLDSAIPGNEIPIGRGRVISGSGRIFSITLDHFESDFMTQFIMSLLKARKLIVVDGLTDEQREQYGVLYSEGEVVKNEGIFDRFLSWEPAEAAEKFAELCFSHRDMVARRVIDAYERRDKRVNRALITALNAVSKLDYEDGKGAFTEIIENMNANEL